MKHNRYIPYGYTYGGEIQAEPTEVEVVKEIFSAYIDGLSYKKVAEMLTNRGIKYHESNPVWNKNMVKRILENENYLGNERYPQIIDIKSFEKASSVIASRRQRDYNAPEEVAIRERLFCGECGERYHKCTSNAKNLWWTCTSHTCRPNFKITDGSLYKGIYSVLSRIINEPNLINVEVKNTAKYKPTVEVIRLTNEINRQLEKSEPHTVDITKMILKCTTARYDACQFDSTLYTTETLKEEFEKSENNFTQLIQKSVSSIIIKKEGEIQIKFKNGAIVCGQITPRKEK